MHNMAMAAAIEARRTSMVVSCWRFLWNPLREARYRPLERKSPWDLRACFVALATSVGCTFDQYTHPSRLPELTSWSCESGNLRDYPHRPQAMTEKAEAAPDTRASPMDPLLLACARVTTSSLGAPLTNASGFLFEHGEQLFLVSSRHVFIDEPSKHFPDRIEVEVHTDAINASRSVSFTVPLYRDGKSLWRQATDSGGEVDVAAIELDRSAWPEEAIYHAFSAEHLADPGMRIDLDTTLLIVGFPLGFHDVLHHLPVVRHAGLASCYGMRFHGQGCFLTDARTHSGISGAP